MCAAGGGSKWEVYRRQHLRGMAEIRWEAGEMQENVETVCDILDQY